MKSNMRIRLRHARLALVGIIGCVFTGPLWAQNCTELCNWYNNMQLPFCQNQSTGFGWENGQSCVARSTCESQYGSGGVIERCDSDSEDEELCNAINGREYFSDALYEMGLSPSGEVKGHRSVRFIDGELVTMQSDYGITGTYHCANGEVIANIPDNSNYLIAFSDDLKSMDFDAFGGSDPVAYSLATNRNADCSLVSDKYYEVDPAHLANITLPDGVTYLLDFRAGQIVDMYLPSGRYDEVNYDCVTGEMHIHTHDFDITPIVVDIQEQGQSLLVQLDSQTQWRFLQQDRTACPNIYEPVCSVELNNYSCLTAPCPDGVYKTYENRCVSDVANALYISEGECGRLEGEYYYDDPQACTTEYDPVCGIERTNIVCITGPCPNEFYLTYGNACEAEAAGSPVLFRGVCGDDREGHPYWGYTAACGADAPYEPLCAAETKTRACLTSPCPKQTYSIFSNRCEMDAVNATFLHDDHCGSKTDSYIYDLSDYFNTCPAVYAPVCGKNELVAGNPDSGFNYQSFGNSCEADIAVADIAWDHQGCGALDGVETGNEPTVRMVASLSEPLKPVSVSNVSIAFDTLKLEISFSGCSTQHFDLEIERAFSESLPVQARWEIIAAVQDDCDAVITDTLTYDLLPLKALYEEAYGNGRAIIVLPGLGDYEINAPEPEPELTVEHPTSVSLGEQIVVRVDSSHPANDYPGSPSIALIDPNGNFVDADNSQSELSLDGPPWTYWARKFFTPENAGDFTVRIQWQAEPELNQESTISVVDDTPVSGCEPEGVDTSAVNEYPNWTARDWPGGPYNHANASDLMSHQGQVYRARWYTSTTPGSDSSWEFVCSL